jgi:hypothetical protein
LDRHEESRRAPLSDASRAAAFSSMAEASWWIASLDECLCTYHDGGLGKNGSGHLARLRDADDRGRYVPGLVWARDRHMHQLGLTTARDTRSFYAPPAGGVLYISAGFIWRDADEVSPSDRAVPRGRAVYDALFAGQKSSAPLAMCEQWFSEVAQTGGSVLQDPRL